MHEHSLMKDLLDKIQQLSTLEKKPLIAVNIQLGALAHISKNHLREHFEHEVSGTTLQGVILNIEELDGIDHPQAQDIVLQSLEFEDSGG
ncbi:hydrogenase/urease maturation nickel metallochaperone HypA [Neptunomonas sp.]|uniref:hydrogenase/urease maturation nickel metallochaperone HypA n=1 Tax=Neptunomonas sp. TaxID=1971898 RepID=UPI00356A656C